MVISVVLFYMVIIGIVAIYYRGASSVDEYLIANRTAGPIQVGAGLFTLIGGGEFVTMAALGMIYGLSGIALFVGYALGFAFLGVFAHKLRKDIDKGHFLSLPDYVYHNYNAAAGLITFVFSFAAFFALLMLQFSAASSVLAAITPIPYEIWVAVIAGSILIYLLIGGLRAVLVTDVLQGVAMLALLPIVLYFLFKTGTPDSSDVLGAESLGALGWIGFLLTGFFVATASADVWQRAYAARSTKTARIGFFLGAALFIVYGAGLILLGIAATKLGIIDPNTAFVQIVSTQFNNNVPALLVTILLVLGAISSTADTELFLLTGMAQKEMQRLGWVSSNRFMVSTVCGVRIILVLICGASVLFALKFRDLVDIYTWLLSALVVISPIILFSLFRKSSPTGMTLSLVGNSVLFAVLVHSGLITLDNVYLIAIPGFVLYSISLFIKPAQGPRLAP